MTRVAEYDILSTLGKGTYGTCYKVRRRQNGALLVMKVISLSGLSHKDREETLNEARLMGSIAHDNIIKYVDSWFNHETLHIVTEYCGGGDLGALIKRKGRLPEERIWGFITDIAKGLNYLHDRRVLHRDVKPGNVFLKGERATIGDLGLGRCLGPESALAYTQVGTPLYFSPEIVEEKPYNDKSDVWAFGCLVYELAAGQPPFLATNQIALGCKIVSEATPRLPEGYSQELQRLVDVMLHKSPEMRPGVGQILRSHMVVLRQERAKMREELALLRAQSKQREEQLAAQWLHSRQQMEGELEATKQQLFVLQGACEEKLRAAEQRATEQLAGSIPAAAAAQLREDAVAAQRHSLLLQRRCEDLEAAKLGLEYQVEALLKALSAAQQQQQQQQQVAPFDSGNCACSRCGGRRVDPAAAAGARQPACGAAAPAAGQATRAASQQNSAPAQLERWSAADGSLGCDGRQAEEEDAGTMASVLEPDSGGSEAEEAAELMAEDSALALACAPAAPKCQPPGGCRRRPLAEVQALAGSLGAAQLLQSSASSSGGSRGGEAESLPGGEVEPGEEARPRLLRPGASPSSAPATPGGGRHAGAAVKECDTEPRGSAVQQLRTGGFTPGTPRAAARRLRPAAAASPSSARKGGAARGGGAAAAMRWPQWNAPDPSPAPSPTLVSAAALQLAEPGDDLQLACVLLWKRCLHGSAAARVATAAPGAGAHVIRQCVWDNRDRYALAARSGGPLAVLFCPNAALAPLLPSVKRVWIRRRCASAFEPLAPAAPMALRSGWLAVPLLPGSEALDTLGDAAEIIVTFSVNNAVETLLVVRRDRAFAQLLGSAAGADPPQDNDVGSPADADPLPNNDTAVPASATCTGSPGEPLREASSSGLIIIHPASPSSGPHGGSCAPSPPHPLLPRPSASPPPLQSCAPTANTPSRVVSAADIRFTAAADAPALPCSSTPPPIDCPPSLPAPPPAITDPVARRLFSSPQLPRPQPPPRARAPPVAALGS